MRCFKTRNLIILDNYFQDYKSMNLDYNAALE